MMMNLNTSCTSRPALPDRRSIAWRIGLYGAGLCAFLTASVAHAVSFHINSVTPRCAQRGTTVEVTMSGNCLEDPRELIFYRPGIRAADISCEKLKNGRYGPVKCRLEIAADCPLGEHPFRIRTATQLTTLATFHVTPFPTIDEVEKKANTNDTFESAVPVTANVTVRGKLGKGTAGDVDLYKVPVVPGERLSVEVDSVRLSDVHYGNSEFDITVRILDQEGRELAANDDNPLHIQDPLVAVRIPDAPAAGLPDGCAFVEVRRQAFANFDRMYCVHIGTNRRPLAAYPAGGPAGQRLTVKLLGDPLGDQDETIAVPDSPGTFEYFGDAPSPLLLRSSPFPNVLENATAAETRVEALPVAVNGILEQPGDSDSFRLSVKKGDRYRLRVFAAALGSPLDPVIRIRPLNAEGKPGPVALEADDAKPADRDIFGTKFRGGGGLKDIADPSVIWEPKADGDYLLEVVDNERSGAATGVYRVEIEQPVDAVHTLLMSTAFDWMECPRTSSLAVPQGNRWTVNVSLPEAQGSTFTGELDIVAHGLPAGVRIVSPRVPAGQSLWPVQFVADPEALPGGAVFTLEARPVDPARKLVSGSHQALPFINHSGGDAWRTELVDRYVMAVTDPAPFSIDIDQPVVSLVRGGELAIPVRITRQAGFDDVVDFQCDWVPKGIAPQPQTTIPTGESTAVLRITAADNAPLGSAPLVVAATTTQAPNHSYLGLGRVRVSSQIVNITVSEPFVALASEPESVRRGERKRFVWTVQHRSPFEGAAGVRLLGLPKGVSVVEPLPVITKESQEIVFEVEATDEALMGSVTGLSCEVTVLAAGQEIHQRSGKGTLRIDPRP